MTITLPDQITELQATIVHARQVLSELRMDPKKRFLHTALAGYLWGVIAIGETVVPLLQTRRAQGAEPLKRYLHESQLDTLFLIAHDADDRYAARSMLSTLHDSRKLLEDYDKVVAAHPEAAIPELKPEYLESFGVPLERQAEELDGQSAEDGGSPDVFSRALVFMRTRRYWHWSGFNRQQMIDDLVACRALTGPSALMAVSLTAIYNSSAHASPSWPHIHFPDPAAGPVFDDPADAQDRDLIQLSIAAVQTISQIAERLAAYFGGNGGLTTA